MVEDPAPDASPLRRRRSSATVPRPSRASTQQDTQPVDEPVAPAPERAAEPVAEPAAVSTHRQRAPLTARTWVVLIAMGLLAGAIAGAIAAYVQHEQTPTYESQSLLEIDQARAVAASPDDGVVAKLARLRYKYAGLVRTDSFAGPIASDLGLPTPAVIGALRVTVDPTSLLIGVGARGSDQKRVAEIADAAASHLVDFANSEQADGKVPHAQRVTFGVVTPAGPALKIAPTSSRTELVGAGAFLFVALATIGFGYLWRRDR